MVLRPVGQHPPAVYWRRRVLVLVAVLIVVVILIRACSGSGGSGSPSASGNHHPARHSTAASKPAVTPCTSADLTAAVTPRPSAASVGSVVHLTGVITNTGTATCLLQITPSELVWTVRSGNVTVWSCPSAFTAQQSLAPNSSVPVKAGWHGKVASPPSCVGTTPAAAGAYSARLRLGRTRSPAAGFTLS